MVAFRSPRSRESKFLVSKISLKFLPCRLCFCTNINAASLYSQSTAIKKISLTDKEALDLTKSTSTRIDTSGNAFTRPSTHTNDMTNSETDTDGLDGTFDSDCGLVCPGNSSEICAGFNSVRVYSTGIGGDEFHGPNGGFMFHFQKTTLNLKISVKE